eukprot:g25656.t1
MSFRFLNWFEGSGGGASSELPQESGYVAPVKNTFIHFGEVDQQPDYRPARSGPAKVETSQTEHRILRSAPLERQASGPAGPPLRMGPCGKLDELPSVGSAGHVTGTWAKPGRKTNVHVQTVCTQLERCWVQ